MRHAVRLERLERRVPKQPARREEWWKDSPLMTKETLEALVALGCERHMVPRELGRVTLGEWLSRASVQELLLVEEEARRVIAADDAARRSGTSP